MRTLLSGLVLVCCACGLPEQQAPSVASRDDAVRAPVDDDGIIIMNGLDPNELGENLLLNDETNRAALIASPLQTSSYWSGPLYSAVRYDARAAHVLSYVVRCALPQGAMVSTPGGTFAGELGLCPAWASSGITGNLTCQTQVTACLLSLSNSTGQHVDVSIRGPGSALTARPAVQVRHALIDGGVARSTAACEGTESYGVDNNCGWESSLASAADAGIGHVFACSPLTKVAVAAGSPTTSSGCSGPVLGVMVPPSDKVLRVCEGVGFCESATAPQRGYDDGGWLLGQSEGDRCTIRPRVEFACPASGLFTVMQRDYAWRRDVTPGRLGVGVQGAWVPTEAQVFPVREGSFFGTLFVGKLGRKVSLSFPNNQPMLTTTVDPTAKAVFELLSACHDARYAEVEAYRHERLCTFSDGQCLSRETGVCQTTADCSLINDWPVGTGSFVNCRDENSVRWNGLTTFLRRPCDLVKPPKGSNACKWQ